MRTLLGYWAYDIASSGDLEKIKLQLTLMCPEPLLWYIPSLQLDVFWVSDILLSYLKRFSQLHHISPLIKYMWKSMALDHCILSLKCFSCLPNDVVNQKIIKNHLDWNLPFLPPNSISLSLQGALWFVTLPLSYFLRQCRAIFTGGNFARMSRIPSFTCTSMNT